MALNPKMNFWELYSAFPALRTDPNFEILSEASDDYNCIAWAMGYNDRWVDHGKLSWHWWPENVERGTSAEALIEAFRAEGFVEAEDGSLEDGYDKVALYKKQEKWTHASRIVSAEKEHSKFGESCDATHSRNVLCDNDSGYQSPYGVVYAYMKRPVSYPKAEKLPSGSISVNEEELARAKRLLKKY